MGLISRVSSRTYRGVNRVPSPLFLFLSHVEPVSVSPHRKMANLMLNLGKPITCFAFNGDKTQVAVGMSDNTVQILRAVTQGPRQSWQKVAVLDKHEGRITGVGHDRCPLEFSFD